MTQEPTVAALTSAGRVLALEELPCASLVTDAEQRILYANAAFLEVTGYPRSELVGKNCRILQGPETDEDTVDRIRASLSAGQSFRGEILNYRADGDPFWNALSIRPTRDADGVVTGFVSAQIDITGEVMRRSAGRAQRETAELLLDVASRSHPPPGGVMSLKRSRRC